MARKPMWLQGETEAWMQRHWHARWSAELLAEELENRTGIALSGRAIHVACAAAFGERAPAKIYVRPAKTRRRMCLRCREVEDIEMPFFTCDTCRSSRAIDGAAEAYSLVGARVR